MKDKRVLNLIKYLFPVLLIIGVIYYCYLLLIKDSINNKVVLNDKYYMATFLENGATAISKRSLTCKVNADNYCQIVLPSIKKKDGYVLGWNTKNSKEAIYKPGDIIAIKGDITFYAITYREHIVNIISDKIDYISLDKVSCYAYNDNAKCNIKLPYYNKKGYETRGYAPYKDALTGVYFPNSDITIDKDITLYPIYNTLSRKKIIDVNQVVRENDIIFEVEKGCNDSMVNLYLNYFKKINNKAKYLLVGSKISFLSDDTFDEIWGENYVGMNYGPNPLRLVDVRCSKYFNNNFYGTIVHELAHTWDLFYSNYFNKTITEESDIINLYTKYKYIPNRPFRNYSYTSIKEFFADGYKYYYFKYIDPIGVYKDMEYPTDIKEVMEKYICITNNNYINKNCN